MRTSVVLPSDRLAGSSLTPNWLVTDSKVAWVRRMESRGIKNYPKRFQSAEGCYSHRATQLPGIRIKVSKQVSK